MSNENIIKRFKFDLEIGRFKVVEDIVFFNSTDEDDDDTIDKKLPILYEILIKLGFTWSHLLQQNTELKEIISKSTGIDVYPYKKIFKFVNFGFLPEEDNVIPEYILEYELEGEYS